MSLWERFHRSASVLSIAVDQEEPEPLHPDQNPILQGYLLPGVHGTYRRYFLELCIVAGLLLPWLGPVLGLAVLTPIVLLTVENGKVIDSTTDCFGGGTGPTTCPATSYFDYYFWNITNPNEFLGGSEPPALEELGPYTFLVNEYRSNVAFSADYTVVNYSSLNYQTFLANQSCAGCSPTKDYLVAVNRGYLAFANSPLIKNNDALAFIPYVPSAMRSIVAGITGALEAAGFPAGAAASAAISQWGRAAYGFPKQTPPAFAEDPTNPEFANWAHVYQGLSFAQAGGILTDAQSATLLTLFQGNPALDTPSGYDGALNVELFAFYPAAQVVATLGMYYPTLGLDALQVERLQGYLFWVALEFVVPTALFGGPTGQLLGPAAGGLLVNRSVNDWINGWTDPLIKQNVSMGFAWATPDSASALTGVPITQLTYEASPLVFQYSLQTGKVAGTMAYTTLLYDDHADVVAYPDTPLPYGTLPVTGSAGGLNFPINVRPDSTFTYFDNTWVRSLNVSFTGEKTVTEGIPGWSFSLVDAEVAGCDNVSQTPPQRCVYPDIYSHTFNASLTYSCPTILSYPHYYKADPVLAESTGFDFSPDPSEHAFTFSVEPVSGYTITANKGYQVNHLVQRTTFLYPSLWLNSSSSIDGLWLPTFWTRSSFEPNATSAASLRSGLTLRRAFIVYPVLVVPPVFGFLLAVGVLFLGLTPASKRIQLECEEIRVSKARATDLTPEEAASVVHIPGDDDHVKDKRSSILELEKRYADFWDSSEYSESVSSPRDSDFTPQQYTPRKPEDGEGWRPDGAHEQHYGP